MMTVSPDLDRLSQRLLQTDHATSFPEEVLDLVSALLPTHGWGSQHLRQIVTQILEARPLLVDDSRYRKLDDWLRKHGS